MTASWQETAERLVRERGSSLTRYATLLTGNPEEAADLVQEALVRTFGRVRNGQQIDQAEAYVRRAIANLFLDGARRGSRWRRIAPLVIEPEATREPTAESAAALDMRRRLDRLSPRERACIVLRYFEDLMIDDIGRELDISSGAVKRYVSDGLRKLGAIIEAEETGAEGAR